MRRALLVLLAAATSVCGQVKISQGTDRISIYVDGKPFTDFFIAADTVKPYLHPLRAASGTIVTRHFPMGIAPGESNDHPHHRGLWFTHGDVNGYDFWANETSQKGAKKGRVAARKVLDLKSGKKSGSVAVLFDWNTPEGKTLLAETRTMTFYSHPAFRIVDLDIVLSAREKVVFGDTKEGTFAIRLAPALEEPTPQSLPAPKRTGKMVSSEGKQGEKEVWGTRAAWVDYFGEIEGEKLGVAILDHPSNPRHPTYWHSRSYGLFAANVFGLRDFLRDKSQDGSMTLEPGASVRFRYRVAIHPGDYQSAGIAGMYKTYSAIK